MKIILKNILSNTLSMEVKNFLAPALNGGLFGKKGTIENLAIYQCTILETNALEYHAVVEIEPDSVAERVINKLNRQKLRGRPVEIAEFQDRCRSNERRASPSHQDFDPPGKRNGERRRQQTWLEMGNRQIIKNTTDRNGGWVSR